MGDLRVRYSLAYGRQNNFYSGIAGQKGYLAGTDGLLGQADTTPDVTLGTLFYTNNSAATTITDFELSHPSSGNGNLSGYWEGKEIKILFLDSNTTIGGARIFLSSSDNTFNRNSSAEFIYHGSAWYETSRSNFYTQNLSLNIAGSQGINTNFIASIVLQVTGAAPVIQSFSGGYLGQRILVINSNSSAPISITTAGNIVAPSLQLNTTGLISIVPSGGVAEFVKTTLTQWAIVGR